MKEADKGRRVHGAFYKYRAFPQETDEEGWKRLENILTKLEAFFPAPSTLNDPFDCYPRIELHGEPQEVRAKAASLVAEQIRQHGIQLSSEAFEQTVSDLVANIQKPEHRNEELFKAVNAGTGVYCMCRRNDSILQWAYYGGDHQGFCLEFTIPQAAKAPFEYVAAVEYVVDRESIDFFDLDGNRDFLWRMVRRKFKEWDHEHEVRAFTTQPGLKRFAAELLTGIVFGAKTSGEHKAWVRAQVAKSGAPPRYYQASSTFTHFKLTIELLDG